MKPLRICIFTETYYPVVGGGETQAQLLAEGLTENGHAVIILTRRSDKSLQKRERLGAVTVHRLPPAGSGQMKKWGLLFSGFPKLISLRDQYDLIFVSGFRIIGISAVLVSKLFHKACVLKADSQGEMSGDFFNSGLQKKGISREGLPFKLFLRLRNRILKSADAFTAISSDIAMEYTSNGVKPSVVHIVPNSADTNRFVPVNIEQKTLLRNKLGIPQSATVVIYTGRLVSYKGLPLLLRVWQKICDKYPDVKLYLVGTGGLDIHNCETELKTYVEENGLTSCVLFTGSVQNVPEYLQASDIFAFPTENDAFPSSLIEAMACALPVITTPVGAIKSIVINGENGVVVQPGDSEQLYQAIDQLISDTTVASHLGSAAWQTVKARYSAGTVTEKYLSLFHNTVSAASGFTPISE